MKFPAVVLVLALAVAACGSSGKDGEDVATGGGKSPGATATGSAPTDKDPLIAYSKCMRENGVTKFPDPQQNQGGGVSLDMPEGTDPKVADAANLKCKKLLPNGGEPVKADPKALEQQRKFARCMREHGLPDFPDPKENGGIQVEGSKDLDPTSPAFKAAEKECAAFQPKGEGSGFSTREEK